MKHTLFTAQKKAGVSAVETIVGVSILTIVVLFSVQALTQFLTIGKEQVLRTQAIYLTEEALEAIRFVRDDSWSTFSTLANNSDLYVIFTTSPNDIALTATPQTLDGFTTVFQLYEVCRDGSDDIESGPCGTPDPDTLYMTATTTWTGGSVALSQYLAKLEP